MGSCLSCCESPADSEVRIGAFNAKRLGKKKIRDIAVRNILVQLMSRYDLLLVTEVQDKKLKHIPILLESIVSHTKRPYSYVISDSLGRASYKEQYLFIFRSDLFQVVEQYHFDDGDEEKGDDIFQREPFVVKFKSKYTDPSSFAVIAIHTSPSFAQEEIASLIDVHNDVVQRWNMDDIVIMGDFNAGCSYVPSSELKAMELYQDDKFYWLVPDSADTTVGQSDCAYDRIVVAGEHMRSSIIPNSATAYRFDEVLSLSDEEATSISDHYPVEFRMRSSHPASKSTEKGELR